jgi:hypothetical protein
MDFSKIEPNDPPTPVALPMKAGQAFEPNRIRGQVVGPVTSVIRVVEAPEGDHDPLTSSDPYLPALWRGAIWGQRSPAERGAWVGDGP